MPFACTSKLDMGMLYFPIQVLSKGIAATCNAANFTVWCGLSMIVSFLFGGMGFSRALEQGMGLIKSCFLGKDEMVDITMVEFLNALSMEGLRYVVVTRYYASML